MDKQNNSKWNTIKCTVKGELIVYRSCIRALWGSELIAVYRQSARTPQVTWVINAAVHCHYLPPRRRLPFQSQVIASVGRYQIILLGGGLASGSALVSINEVNTSGPVSTGMGNRIQVQSPVRDIYSGT